jgi:hypothetical protein
MPLKKIWNLKTLFFTYIKSSLFFINTGLYVSRNKKIEVKRED